MQFTNCNSKRYDLCNLLVIADAMSRTSEKKVNKDIGFDLENLGSTKYNNILLVLKQR